MLAYKYFFFSFVIVDIVVQPTAKMINTGKEFVQLNANDSNVYDSDDSDEKSFRLYDTNDPNANTFDEKNYIKSILENQIRDLENNNSELSDYERAVLNKYMNDIDMNNDMCDTRTQQTFPVQQSNDSLTTFPTKDEEMIALKSSVTDDQSLVARENNKLHSADKTTILNQTQVVNSKRNNVSNNRNARSVLRRQFSLWVGVTSCLWGLLLYLDKTYF